MKTKLTLLTLAVLAQAQARSYTENDLLGVYRLTKFATLEASGAETPWCHGVKGSIAYLPGHMSVAINCESSTPGTNAALLGGKLFYSGPYAVDKRSNEVLHQVENYSHPSLYKVHRRTIGMSRDKNFLRLSGELGAGKQIVIEWEREESFSPDDNPLTGVYELVGSENEVAGSDEKIPFCSGFHGSIFYTPGGYGSVSINCGPKTNASLSEPADAFDRQYFYAGSYEQINSLLIQQIELASVASQAGGEAVREMSLEGDILTLKGSNGSSFVARWKKVRGFSKIP